MKRIIEAHSHEFDPVTMEALKKKGFEKVFLMHKDAAFIEKSVKAHPDFVVGVGWLPMWEGVRSGLSAIDRFRRAGCSALKICMSCCPYDDEKMYPIYAKAQRHNLPVSFHTGWLWVKGAGWLGGKGEIKQARSLAMWYHPMTLDRITTDFPGLKLLMNHMGHPWVKEGACMVNAHTNIYADLCINSAFTWDPDYFWHEIGGEATGYNVLFKTMFGSDAFSQGSLDHLAKIETLFDALAVPPAIRKRAFYGNALEFIGAAADEKKSVEVSGVPVKAGGLTDLNVKRFGEPAKARTECLISVSSSGFNFKFECFDRSAAKAVIASEGVPEQIWQDDCVEIILAPDSKNYLHFSLNPKGQAGVDKNRFSPVKFTGKASGSIKAGKWSGELFIPFQMFGGRPKTRDTWGFNMMRSKKTSPAENSVWNETVQTLHNRDGFGKLIFK